MGKQAADTPLVDYLKRGYGSLVSSFSNVQPQMPKEQIAFFLKQAVRKQTRIIVQVNPTSHADRITEFGGVAYFTPKSTQIILKTDNQQTTYLLNAKDIRHIRRMVK